MSLGEGKFGIPTYTFTVYLTFKSTINFYFIKQIYACCYIVTMGIMSSTCNEVIYIVVRR